MPTVQGVRYLVAVPDLPDEQIQYLIDGGYTSDIDVAIALCDYMASLVANSTDIKVGPISLSGSQSADAWNKIKKDLILRKNLGAGVPGGGFGALMGAGSVTLTGVAPPVIRRGQFDNPPITLEDSDNGSTC
jgi:hypothetical protein